MSPHWWRAASFSVGAGGLARRPCGRPTALAQTAGVKDCDGLRVRTLTDSEYCGDCDTRCPETQHCVAGQCMPDIHTAVADDGCNARYLRLWFNGFMPGQIPNLTHWSPAGDGTTVIDPIFSSAGARRGRSLLPPLITAASRLNDPRRFTVPLCGRDRPAGYDGGRCRPSRRLDDAGRLRNSANPVCSEQLDTAALEFSTPWTAAAGRHAVVRLERQVGHPCIAGGPVLDYDLRVVLERAAGAGEVKIQVSGARQQFPAFEIYAALDGSVPVPIFQRGPDAGAAFGDLYFAAPEAPEPIATRIHCGCGQCETGAAAASRTTSRSATTCARSTSSRRWRTRPM